MFQFLRRVSGSFLPRPDRPWRDDATSHAPTIGRKRRHSVTEQDGDASAMKRAKNNPVEPDAASGEENPKGDVVPQVEGQAVKEVTKGVKKVDLEDRDGVDASTCPEGVPLPDSPSASPEPEPELQEPAQDPEVDQSDEIEGTEVRQHADEDSVSSSAHEDDTEEEPATTSTDVTEDEVASAQEVPIESAQDVLEVKA